MYHWKRQGRALGIIDEADNLVSFANTFNNLDSQAKVLRTRHNTILLLGCDSGAMVEKGSPLASSSSFVSSVFSIPRFLKNPAENQLFT